MLHFASFGKLQDGDIPHRTALKDSLLRLFDVEMCAIKKDLQVSVFPPQLRASAQLPSPQSSLGRISITTDVWSNTSLTAFMAVTAHYCQKDENGRLELRHRLIAFRHIKGAHTGSRLGKEMVKILQEVGILGRVSLFRSMRFDGADLFVGFSSSTASRRIMLRIMKPYSSSLRPNSQKQAFHLIKNRTVSGSLHSYLDSANQD